MEQVVDTPEFFGGCPSAALEESAAEDVFLNEGRAFGPSVFHVRAMPKRLSWQRSEPVVLLKPDKRDRTPFYGNGQPGFSPKKPHRTAPHLRQGAVSGRRNFCGAGAVEPCPAGQLAMRQGRSDRLHRGAPLAGQHSSRGLREARGEGNTVHCSGPADWRMLFTRRTVSREHAQGCFHTVQGIVVQGRSQCFLDGGRPPFLSRAFPAGVSVALCWRLFSGWCCSLCPCAPQGKDGFCPEGTRGRPVSGTQE